MSVGPLRATALRSPICLLALVLTLSSFALACGGAATEENSRPRLEAVQPPPDLATLDREVRLQLGQLQARLEHAQFPAAKGSETAGAAWGNLGRWFDVYGYGESAARCFRNAHRLDPKEPRWPYYLGRLAEKDGRLQEAEARYREATALAPDEAGPEVRLGDVALRLQDLGLAERSYKKVLASDPDDPGALFGSARVALAQNQPRQAIQILERLEKSQPHAAQLNYTLSLAWRRLGYQRRADEFLHRVPKVNIDQIPLDYRIAWDRELNRVDVGARKWTRLALRASHRGQLDRAAVFFARAVEADPEGPEKRINYAVALSKIGRWPAAYAQLRAAIEKAKPGSELAARAHLGMGRLLVERRRPTAAARELIAALAIDPGSITARLQLGNLRLRQGKLEAALVQYEAVRSSPTEVAGVRFWHAALLLALHREEEAYRSLIVDVKEAKEPRGVRLLLARLLSTATRPGLRDVPRARRLLAEPGPADVLYAETAAMVAAAGSQFAEAESWERAAIAALAGLRARAAAGRARRRLALYEERKPCRTPWEATESLVKAPVTPPPSLRSNLSAGPETARKANAPTSPSSAVGLPESRRQGLVLPTTTGTEGSTTNLPVFRDVAAKSGLKFEHHNGGTGHLYFVEPVGPGGALVDLDGDGDLDVVLVQGRQLAAPGSKEAANPDTYGGTRVFRNDLSIDAHGRRTIHFTDVTKESGLSDTEYGMGIATGDYDNDGRPDLYITAFGHNELWRNVSTKGHIRFENVTAKAGVDDPRWSTSASFADLNGDGLLDLFVTNYVDFRLSNHRQCRSPGGRPDFCGPLSYHGQTDRIFLNNGDGTFRDVSAEAGILTPGNGLGVVADDFDGDGRLDVYVANDLQPNFLWKNLGNKDGVPRFENVALESGCAVSMLGQAQASMGIVDADLDNDGDDDLFMTHLRADTNTLYINDGHGLFTDRSDSSGLANPSLAFTGFGTAAIDFDNDGWLDVFVANGAVKTIESEARAGDPLPLKQRNQIFENRNGTFINVSAKAGPELKRLEVSRGVAIGDVDNDGKSDILLVNNDGPARLLLNETPSRNHWLGLRILTRRGRDALGARVEVVLPGKRTLWRRVATDGSYLSASDPRVLVGLGDASTVSAVRIHWVGGKTQTWTGLEVDRYYTLVAGKGKARTGSTSPLHP